MRLLILLESLVVIGLAVSILLTGGGPAQVAVEGDLFAANRFLGDANPGEIATYRGDDGSTVEFRVAASDRGGPGGIPWLSVSVVRRDRTGAVESSSDYRHYPHKHGLFPLLAPEDPSALDRVWVWRRIRRASFDWQKKKVAGWRVECVDPALPAAQDAVEVWMNEDVPVFGILRWTRQGRTYECVSWKAAP